MYSNIYGPYFKNGHYHLHLYLLDGARKYRSFTTEEDALEFVRLNQRRVVTNPITMSEAIDKYLGARTDLRPSSRATLQFRLRALIKGSEKTSLQLFSAMTAWNRLVRDNAVDTLHGIRSSAKGFFDWCVRNSYLKKHPFADLEIVGKKKRGKPQLRMDEARAFLARALAVANGESLGKHADNHEQEGALGAATALLLGLRNGEVVACQVRDLDDQGRVLWIAASKTEAGIRRVEVPEILGASLIKLAGGREGTAPLFPGLTRDGMRYWTKALCEKLGLPKITPHGLRGTHATASMRPHANPREVAAALGHASFTVTQRHYARADAVAEARQQAATEALIPSKDSSKNFGRESDPIHAP